MGVLAPDPQRLVEALDGVSEVAGEGLNVAEGGVGAGVEGGEDEGLLVEGHGLLVAAQLPVGVAQVVQQTLPLVRQRRAQTISENRYTLHYMCYSEPVPTWRHSPPAAAR